jgi:prophage regulatory protein
MNGDKESCNGHATRRQHACSTRPPDGSVPIESTPRAPTDLLPAIRILRLPEVCRVTGLGRTMIYRLQLEHRFPQSVKITDYAVGWVEGEVQAWLAEQATRRKSRPDDALLVADGQ